MNDMRRPKNSNRMIQSMKPIVEEVVQQHTQPPGIPLPLEGFITQQVGSGSIYQGVKELVHQEEQGRGNKCLDQRCEQDGANAEGTAGQEVFEVVHLELLDCGDYVFDYYE